MERSVARRRVPEVALERFLSVCRTGSDVRAVYAFGSFALRRPGRAAIWTSSHNSNALSKAVDPVVAPDAIGRKLPLS